MAKIYQKLTELIGNTPLVDLQRLTAQKGVKAQILAKVEYFNPGGSVKDRIALNMIEDAEKKGILKPGSVILELTSGNTGVGLAWISRVKGYEAIIVMPETMSRERQNLLRAAGAKLVLTSGALGMKGAIAEANKLKEETPGAVILQQFQNPANPEVHFQTTGKEIWEDTDGQIDVFVAGVGTGGTISGVGRYLKKQNPNVKVIKAVTDFTDDYSVIDEIVQVKDDDAILTGRELSLAEGLLVGISSGAATYAALQVAQRPEFEGKRIVALLPDTGERYLSTLLYAFEDYPL